MLPPAHPVQSRLAGRQVPLLLPLTTGSRRHARAPYWLCSVPFSVSSSTPRPCARVSVGISLARFYRLETIEFAISPHGTGMARALARQLPDALLSPVIETGTCCCRSCLGRPASISPYSPCAGPETRPPGRLILCAGGDVRAPQPRSDPPLLPSCCQFQPSRPPAVHWVMVTIAG